MAKSCVWMTPSLSQWVFPWWLSPIVRASPWCIVNPPVLYFPTFTLCGRGQRGGWGGGWWSVPLTVNCGLSVVADWATVGFILSCSSWFSMWEHNWFSSTEPIQFTWQTTKVIPGKIMLDLGIKKTRLNQLVHILPTDEAWYQIFFLIIVGRGICRHSEKHGSGRLFFFF